MDKLSEEKTYSRRKYMEQRSRENVKVASGPVNYTILKDVLKYVTVQPNFIALQMRLIVNTYLRRLSPNSHPPMEICNQQGTGTGGRGPFYKLDRITRRICRRYKYNIKFPTKKKVRLGNNVTQMVGNPSNNANENITNSNSQNEAMASKYLL